MTWRPKEELLEDQKSCPCAGRQDRYAELIEFGGVNGVSDEKKATDLFIKMGR